MTKDAVATMGAILPNDAGGRDAVHVAVFSAVSTERLYPGQDITIISHEERDARVAPGPNAVAIVDPFLRAAVPAGERFWAYLYPRTITALSHRWSHPAFESEAATAYVPPAGKLRSEEWLRAFCDTADCPGYLAVIAKAEEFLDGALDSDESLFFVGRNAQGDIPPEFWTHVGVVLGRVIPPKVPAYFLCSC
jgi:hypothetical protein